MNRAWVHDVPYVHEGYIRDIGDCSISGCLHLKPQAINPNPNPTC